MGDVQVFFEGTAAGSPSVPLSVTGVSPVAGTGNNQFGFTQFTITFDPTPSVPHPATYNYTGTYSYLIAPDNGAGTAIAAPIELVCRSRRHAPSRAIRWTRMPMAPSIKTR